MPEIRECFVHYKHAHYVLVEQLLLGQDKGRDWALQDLFADATDEEARVSRKKSSKSSHSVGLTSRHGQGYVDKIDSACTLTRGQKSHQTMIWPGTAKSPETLDGLVLSGLSYTPRSLILKFGKLDLQV